MKYSARLGNYLASVSQIKARPLMRFSVLVTEFRPGRLNPTGCRETSKIAVKSAGRGRPKFRSANWISKAVKI